MDVKEKIKQLQQLLEFGILSKQEVIALAIYFMGYWRTEVDFIKLNEIVTYLNNLLKK